MGYLALADAVVVFHLAFILFVVLGGLAVARWPRIAWLHLPAATWGTLIELVNWSCPLTPLENWLRSHGGESSYEHSFVEHYLLPLVYPTGLTRNVQIALGFVVVSANVAVYAWVGRRRRRRFTVSGTGPKAPRTS